MSIQRVSRIAADGTTVSVTIGRHEFRCLKAGYGDKLETETGAEMGSQEIDYRTPGKYTTEELTLTFEYVKFHEEISPKLQFDGFGNEQMPIVVGVSHPDLGDDSDLLDLCRFVSQKDAVEAGSGARVVETTWTTDQIYWGEERKTRNKRDLSLPLNASNF